MKGVIGMICPAEEMPYTSDGIIPDIVMNPHALPSRQTASVLYELLLGKHALYSGKFNSDIKEEYNFDHIGDTNSYEGVFGNETMYDGKTGFKLENDVNIGIIYFYALKHLSSKKLRCRNEGKIDQITCQPSKSGQTKGLRLGEMEQDMLKLHNCSDTIIERTITQCDLSKTRVCKVCGLIEPPETHEHENRNEVDTQIVEVEIPHSTRVVLLEAIGMGIQPRLTLK